MIVLEVYATIDEPQPAEHTDQEADFCFVLHESSIQKLRELSHELCSKLRPMQLEYSN
jgi:hypothetical protein